MNKQDEIKKNNPPQDYFQGKDLKMAEAIYGGNIYEVENLIKNSNYDVNTRGNGISEGRIQNFTYLSYAVLIGETQSAEKLLQSGADINLIAFDGGGQLGNINMACDRKNKRMINLLLKYKVDLNNPLSGSPLSNLLIYNADENLIELLVNRGAEVNHQDYIDGGTPMVTALNINKFNKVHYFLDQGADPMLLDTSGNSLAYLVQEEINERRLSDYGLKEYTKLKDRLTNEFHVKFPLKNEFKKGREKNILRYEQLSEKNKELLGDKEASRIEFFRKGLMNMTENKMN